MSSAIFSASRDMDVRRLPSNDTKMILPRLVRFVLCRPASPDEPDGRKKALMLAMLDIAEVNKVVELLSVEFRAVEEDCRKLQDLRKKTFDLDGAAAAAATGQTAVQEFENSGAARKLRLVISEVLWCIAQVKGVVNAPAVRAESILDVDLYALDISYALCIAAAELPSLLPICDVAEGLLWSKRACDLIVRLVANCPDSFVEVCKRLIDSSASSAHDERRLQVLKALCCMNEYGMAIVQNYCLQMGMLPELVLWTFTQDARHVTDDPHTVVTCLASLINRNMRKEDVANLLVPVRELLLTLLSSIAALGSRLTDKGCMVALVLLQLYASLKELCSHFRLSEGECRELLRVMHLLPPDCRLANRWACLSLCFVVASAQHFEYAHLDKQIVAWLRWLMEQHERLEECAKQRQRQRRRQLRQRRQASPARPCVPSALACQAAGLCKWSAPLEQLSRESGGTTVGQLLFLMSIHFHSNQLHAVSDLVTSVLDIKSSAVKTSSLAHIKLVFTQEVFTEQVVCQLATKVKVTKNVNDLMTSYLPLHCVYQLVRSKAFSKYKVPIKDWVYMQLCEAKLPIHHSLPQLLRVYVNSTLPLAASTGRHDNLNEPITEEEIGRLFSSSTVQQHCSEQGGNSSGNGHIGDDDHFPAQLLLMTYVLLHQDAVNTHWKQLATSGRKPFTYSNQLLSRIPIKALLLKCRSLQTACAGLFAIAMRLVVTLYPHLCLAEGWMPDDAASTATGHAAALSPPQPAARLLARHAASLAASAAPGGSEAATAQVCWHARLQAAAAATGHGLVPRDSTVEVLMQALDVVLRLQQGASVASTPGAHRTVARRLADSLKSLWLTCGDKLPRRLYINTVNAMRRWSDGGSLNVTEEDVFADPLILLQCNKALLRCPPLLEIALKLLECYLVASENFYEAVARRSSAPEAETTELKYAALAAQESAAVQLLLEHCLPSSSSSSEATCLLTDHREIQSIICSFVHRVFIRNPNIAKLVHFQGYDRQLIPVAVAGIPSAHICIDYIPELLAQPDIHKQTFAVELTSVLCQHYPLPRTLSVAKLCISTMLTLMTVLPMDSVIRHIAPLLPSMYSMCRTMQPLAEDWVEFLARFCAIAFAYRGAFVMNKIGFLDGIFIGTD